MEDFLKTSNEVITLLEKAFALVVLVVGQIILWGERFGFIRKEQDPKDAA